MSIIDDLFKILNEDEKGETDPKAKVRNKPNPVFSAGSSNVKDNKDHFPLGTVAQARNALARANQYSSVPKWYNGTLKSLKSAVASAVKKAYPSINVSKKATD